MKKISVLGSTGSIGVQTLEVVRNLNYKITALAANSNIDLLEKQALEFNPDMVAIGDETLADKLFDRLKGTGIKVFGGLDGLINVAARSESDILVTSVVGISGLIPTLEAIKNGKDIALANKETLVTAGELVMSLAKKHNVNIYPIDSEHSAIFQCIGNNDLNYIEKIILTASGGPFRGRGLHQLKDVTVEQALKHPNWCMGNKITIDSATLMNKGLEVIEAKWLFDVSISQIEVLVHPQSIIHSMVEYVDGSVMAQLGSPDMRVPIQFALTYPQRMPNNFPKLDLLKAGQLTFEKPDIEVFRCLGLAFEALKAGGTMPVVLNAANEVAVELFLRKKIRFLDIPRIIEDIMGKHSIKNNPNFDDIIKADISTREQIGEMVKCLNASKINVVDRVCDR